MLQGSKRIQLNTQLKPSNTIDVFAHVPAVTVPLVWVDEVINTSL